MADDDRVREEDAVGVPAGVPRDTADEGSDDADPATEGTDVPDPIPEADSPETEEAWEESGPMGGEAPTG